MGFGIFQHFLLFKVLCRFNNTGKDAQGRVDGSVELNVYFLNYIKIIKMAPFPSFFKVVGPFHDRVYYKQILENFGIFLL